jgi:hypothetical protein
LQSQVQQLDVGNRYHQIAAQDDSRVEEPVQQFQQRVLFVFGRHRVISHGDSIHPFIPMLSLEQNHMLAVLWIIMRAQRFRKRIELFQEPGLFQIEIFLVDLAHFQPPVEFTQGGHGPLLLVLKVLPGGFFHFAANSR